MIFFTSDLHFGDKNILSNAGRPFSSIEEMEETLINNWNSKVRETDAVYILGDVFYRFKGDIATYLSSLNGNKHLVIGNHDYQCMKSFSDINDYFRSVSHLELINIGKNLLTLCHYPLLEWNRSRNAKSQESSSSWLIHGHIHNEKEGMTFKFIKENLPCALNAGVDINGFAPVSFDELLENNNRWYGRD